MAPREHHSDEGECQLLEMHVPPIERNFKRSLMRNMSVLYGRSWQRVNKVTCTGIRLSRPLSPSDKGYDDDGTFGTERVADLSLFGRPHPLSSGRKRDSVKHTRGWKHSTRYLSASPIWSPPSPLFIHENTFFPLVVSFFISCTCECLLMMNGCVLLFV